MSWDVLAAPEKKRLRRRMTMKATETVTGAMRIVLSIPVEMLEVIGTSDDRYTVQVGRQEDAGYIRLSKEKFGAFQPKRMKSAAVFYLGEPSFTPGVAQPRTEVSFEPHGAGAIKIRLPKWCFIEDLSKRTVPTQDAA